jgi:hypothetical protein
MRSARKAAHEDGVARVCRALGARPTFVRKGGLMLWTITVILLVLWVVGLVSGASVGAWVHILLVLAIISLIFAVLRRGSAAV